MAWRNAPGLATFSLLKLLGVTLSSLVIGALALTLPQDRREPKEPVPVRGRLQPQARAVLLSFTTPRGESRYRWRIDLRVQDGTFLDISGSGPQFQVLEKTPTTARIAAVSRAPAAKKGRKRRRRKRAVTAGTPAVVRLTLRGNEETVMQVSTDRGECAIRLADVAPGRSLTALDGLLTASGSFPSVQLTQGTLEEDFPAAAVAADGTVWVAYTSYVPGGPIQLPDEPLIPKDWSSLVPEGNGDQVLLARYERGRWSGPLAVSKPLQDVWRPAVAVDGQGRVIVAWSQNFSGNWDLVIRTYDPATDTWSEPQRLGGPGAEIHVVAATDAHGRVWLACQSWQQGNFDIVVVHQAEQGWSKPIRIGSGSANEWTPAIACDARGNVFVAYDTYERGDYDVKLAIIEPGSRSPQIVDITHSPRFEARPSIAVDAEDRVWIAYEQAGPNWGKDQGQRWRGPSGESFYFKRSIIVRCWTKDGLKETVGRIEGHPRGTRYPQGRFQRISLPRIAVADDGRIWVVFRQHPLASGSGEVWTSFATYYDGDRWSQPVPVPNSRNLLDNRPPLVPLADGRLLLIHSTDYRARTANRQQNDLYATILYSDEPVAAPKLRAPVDKPVHAPVVHANEPEDVRRIREFRFELAGKRYRLLRGEFHRHTELTAHRDQDGLFEAIFRYALDVARMDWIGPGDHDNGAGHQYMWWLTQKQVDIYHHPPVLVPMFTYERSVRYPSGHRNVMFARRGIRPLPRLSGQNRLMGTPQTGAPDIKRLYAYLRHFGGICSVHTSATGMGTDWRDNDPEVEPVVEIYQGHRQNYEHPGAPYTAKGPADSIGGYQPAGYVWNALKKGYKLGFQVSSDHVSTHLSYGVVAVEEVSREAILAAFKQRHSYGAMDNIIAVVTCGDHMMGDAFTTTTKPTLHIQVIGTAPVARISIIRGVKGETPSYVFEQRPNKQAVTIDWTDDAPLSGTEAYYYVRVEQADGRVAWISPMWITYQP